MELFSLTERVAVVTGGAKGIGAGYAEALLGAGARVVVADIDAAAVHATVSRLASAHPEDVLGAEVDVTDRARLRALGAVVEHRWGRLDILVNNAALFAAFPRRLAAWRPL